jgi:hypothetical protein
VRISNLLAAVCIASLFTPAARAALTPQKPYYPADFYSRIDEGLRDSDLKEILFTILSSGHTPTKEGHDTLSAHCANAASGCYEHTSLGYRGARQLLFGQIHLQRSGSGYSIYDVYCQTTITAKESKRQPPGPGLIPDPNVLNAEHTWPQSHFSRRFNTNLQKSDVHILYPVASDANSSRGNLDFGNVVTETTSPCAKARRGFTNDGTGEQFFEPPDAHKGNVARAIFYFSVRYKMRVPAEEEASLKAWSHLDPVDDFERARNDAIFAAQHDRNPFIDYPELADLISDF